MAIPAVTRVYTPGSCCNLRNRMRHPPRWEMRLDSPTLHAEQSRIPNQTCKDVNSAKNLIEPGEDSSPEPPVRNAAQSKL